MTKILFICHGNQVREANLQIILDYPAFIEYLALLVLQPLSFLIIGKAKATNFLRLVAFGFCYCFSCYLYRYS